MHLPKIMLVFCYSTNNHAYLYEGNRNIFLAISSGLLGEVCDGNSCHSDPNGLLVHNSLRGVGSIGLMALRGCSVQCNNNNDNGTAHQPKIYFHYSAFDISIQIEHLQSLVRKLMAAKEVVGGERQDPAFIRHKLCLEDSTLCLQCKDERGPIESEHSATYYASSKNRPGS